MKNVLQWNPPEGLHGIELAYTVEYFIYGQKQWLSKSECRHINRTYCDLSAETSDYEHQYYAKVKAIWETNCSEWAETHRFYPLWETKIGPPEFVLNVGEKSISIVLMAPEKWKRNPEDPTVSMEQIYSNLKYNISLYNNKSKAMWSQFVTNHTLELSWLQPNTLYCVTAESFVPGLLRSAQSSQQCVSTLKDQISAFKIIFWYVFPMSVALLLFSVIGYSIYQYIHVGKEKHPANLLWIYESGFDKRFFMPAEKINFNILDDSKVPQEKVENMDERSGLPAPEPSWTAEPHLEEAWTKHIGYASHVMENFSDLEESGQGASLNQEEWLGIAVPTEKAAIEYKYHVQADISPEPAGDQLGVQEEGPKEGTLPVQQAFLAQTFLCSYTPRLCDVEQKHTVPGEGREEPPMTLLDWNPERGRLCIPSLSSFDPEPEDRKHREGYNLPEQSLLSRLYEKPAEESEDYLMGFMEEWRLYVQMEN
ncbi:interleukin-20 receptor subunit alpha [Thomomys bottae]